jgi:hypothetical protein
MAMTDNAKAGQGTNHANEGQGPSSFEKAGEEGRLSLMQEFLYFLAENKKWWMLPILCVMGLVILLVVASGTGAAPFIYTMF